MKRERMTKLFRNNEGSTIIEFAIVAPIFFLLMMGIIEFGMYMVTEIALESAVGQAGRVAAVRNSSGGDVVQDVRDTIRRKITGLPRSGSVVISAKNVNNGPLRVPDLCLINGANGVPTSDPTCPPGIAFIDNNGNGVYDGSGGVSLGNPGDLIEVRADYPWRILFPLLTPFFVTRDSQGNEVRGLVLISATTVVKNEPAN